MAKLQPKETPTNSQPVQRSELWMHLAKRVEFEDDEMLFLEHLGQKDEIIEEILKAIKEHPGQEKQFTLPGSKAEVQLFWDDDYMPVLHLITEHMPEFLQEFSHEIRSQPYASANNSGRHRSLSDLGFAHYQAHGQPPYLCLDGSEEAEARI
jgi:hypothetical protein